MLCLRKDVILVLMQCPRLAREITCCFLQPGSRIQKRIKGHLHKILSQIYVHSRLRRKNLGPGIQVPGLGSQSYAAGGTQTRFTIRGTLLGTAQHCSAQHSAARHGTAPHRTASDSISYQRLTVPYRLEGATLANHIAASGNYQHPCSRLLKEIQRCVFIEESTLDRQMSAAGGAYQQLAREGARDEERRLRVFWSLAWARMRALRRCRRTRCEYGQLSYVPFAQFHFEGLKSQRHCFSSLQNSLFKFKSPRVWAH